MALIASASSSCPERITTGTFGAFCMIRRKVSAPWLSGRFKSSSTSVGVSASRQARASARRGTQFTWTADLPSTSRRRTKSASPGLSSISKTRAGSCSISLVVLSWQARTAEPELFDRLQRGQVIFQISGLADVAVGAQFVTARDIQDQVRSTEHHDGDGAQIRVPFYLRQYRSSVFLRQIQIQDYKVGTGFFHVDSPSLEKGQRFFAVPHAFDLDAMEVSLQRLAG